MTIAEIVAGLLKTPCIGCNGTKLASCPDCSGTGIEPWSKDDYEKGWLVVELIKAEAKEVCHWQRHTHEWCDGGILTVLIGLRLSPSNVAGYAELERRVREWEKDHG
mgnify:CR=1 FL=1